ncbi:phosphoethanolamine transferase [Fulvimonas soli]|uniref:Lipid A ethanolaminephosphotransferase n=1 Tax=Fulvimonas soli TaxID=155197 RepID=A0A316HW49_9GAMM|nr:phosphoethanolamine--lipid A transferase [Fulvimonas soli]PWK84350.1 lipid A ethanolaminephosphotransferase [Fulvimonas soli]
MTRSVDWLTGAWRRGMPSWWLGLLVALYFLIFLNHTMWRELAGDFAPTGGIGAQPLFALAVALRIVGNVLLVVALSLWPRVGKPLLALLLVVGAASAYHMDVYGVRFNEDVVQSIYETQRAEAAAMLTRDMLLWVGLFGVLPAALVLCVPVRYAPWRRELSRRIAVVAGVLLLMHAPGLLAKRNFTYFFRNHRVVYEVYNPYAALSGTFHYLQRNVFRRERPVQPVGQDAALDPAAAAGRKRVLVLVVGETARAENYALQGYARDTNPEMARAGAWYFRDVWSCGTATTVSVPCMFSGLGREHFDKARARARWNLLDVVQHAGVDVFWRDNDEGCKGVCARVPSEDLTDARVEGLCDASGCLDDVLLADLPQRLAKMRSPALLVLHLKGSHGPAYYQRYPAAFARFRPTCDTAEVQTCGYAQVVNTYDNTILYTDHILGRIVDMLKADGERYDGAMLYLSDHGESLGEHDVYLHGASWDSAPTQQKHIPLLLWLSPAWQRDAGLAASCIEAQRGRRLSQDNLYHTVLGLLGVRTALYQKELDFLAPCR